MAHRQIVLDTETTGIDPKQGHRIIEIGCVELVNRRLTGNNFPYKPSHSQLQLFQISGQGHIHPLFQ